MLNNLLYNVLKTSLNRPVEPVGLGTRYEHQNRPDRNRPEAEPDQEPNLVENSNRTGPPVLLVPTGSCRVLNVGISPREIRTIGFSFCRFYRFRFYQCRFLPVPSSKIPQEYRTGPGLTDSIGFWFWYRFWLVPRSKCSSLPGTEERNDSISTDFMFISELE